MIKSNIGCGYLAFFHPLDSFWFSSPSLKFSGTPIRLIRLGVYSRILLFRCALLPSVWLALVNTSYLDLRKKKRPCISFYPKNSLVVFRPVMLLTSVDSPGRFSVHLICTDSPIPRWNSHFSPSQILHPGSCCRLPPPPQSRPGEFWEHNDLRQKGTRGGNWSTASFTFKLTTSVRVGFQFPVHKEETCKIFCFCNKMLLARACSFQCYSHKSPFSWSLTWAF